MEKKIKIDARQNPKNDAIRRELSILRGGGVLTMTDEERRSRIEREGKQVNVTERLMPHSWEKGSTSSKCKNG